MIKRALFVVSAIAILLAIGFAYLLASNRNQEKILDARVTMERLEEQKDSLLTVVRRLDSAKAVLEDTASRLMAVNDSLRGQVDRLEEANARDQLTVRQIRKPEDLLAMMEKTFPEVAGSDWGVTEVMSHKADPPIGIQYLLIPLYFAETFIINEKTLQMRTAQVGLLRKIDTLNVETIALKDSIIRLTEEKSNAYRVGFDSAFKEYKSLNAEYIAELKKPRIGFGVPAIAALLGSAAVGVAVGVVAAQ